MGGQGFGEGCEVMDLREMNQVVSLDVTKKLVRVAAGMQWPGLIDALRGSGSGLTIRQKQTGADEMTIGGAVAVNMHGRGLGMAPFIDDLEELQVVIADGSLLRCSRDENMDLFSRVVGGYGCFGIVVEVTLRLVPLRNYRRDVTMISADRVVHWLTSQQKKGGIYGDFQFQIDPADEGFLRDGISACYFPDENGGEHPDFSRERPELDSGRIEKLLALAHSNPGEAFRQYTAHYSATDGCHYTGDEMQLSAYPTGYHARMDGCSPGSEMISELYIPRSRLEDFLGYAAVFLRQQRAQVIYGTVRLIERDAESALAWARQPWACIVFNLHVDHSRAGLDKARREFRGLIDLALQQGGTFYLTYHRWATRRQLLQAYPQLPQWLERQSEQDPEKIWGSDWLRNLRETLAKMPRQWAKITPQRDWHGAF